MKLNKKESDRLLEFQRKILYFFKDPIDLMHVFSTLLGAAHNVATYLLEREKGNYENLPYQCRYGMIHAYKILSLVSKILQDKIPHEDFKIDGFFPNSENTWSSEEDFEKRFILLIKLYHADLKEKGLL